MKTGRIKPALFWAARLIDRAYEPICKRLDRAAEKYEKEIDAACGIFTGVSIPVVIAMLAYATYKAIQ